METIFLSILGLFAALSLVSQLVRSALENTCPGRRGNSPTAPGQQGLPPQCAHCRRCSAAIAPAVPINTIVNNTESGLAGQPH